MDDPIAARNAILADEIRRMIGTGNSSYYAIFRAIQNASVDIRDHFARFDSLELLESPGLGKRAKEVVTLLLKYGMEEGRSIFRHQRAERRRRKSEAGARAIRIHDSRDGSVGHRYDWEPHDWEEGDRR